MTKVTVESYPGGFRVVDDGIVYDIFDSQAKAENAARKLRIAYRLEYDVQEFANSCMAKLTADERHFIKELFKTLEITLDYQEEVEA